PDEAYAYLEKLKSIIQYTGVSDVRMEEGSLRCDANISLRPEGQEEFGTKVELKNLNSFAFVKSGLEYEEKRQAKILSEGVKMKQETDVNKEKTKKPTSRRIKPGAIDYGWFPDPVSVPFEMDAARKEKARAEFPGWPVARQQRYVEEMELSAYDAGV